MEDTNQNITSKPQPAILDIKPVEHLEKVVEVQRPEPPDEEELEDLKDDDIFIKPQKENKKKKVLSERQKAHMEKMRLARKKKLEEKNKTKPKKVEPKNVPLPPPKTEVREAPAQNFTGHGHNMSNQEYMKQFFNNMNMFMESYNKLNEVKAKKPSSNPQPIPQKDHFKDMKPKKKVKETPPPKNTDCSYSIDFLKSSVGYNYKNPFGF